jgi:ABC-type bacteriocin/lantibiotic exporter with double-glycine peptidase domain
VSTSRHAAILSAPAQAHAMTLPAFVQRMWQHFRVRKAAVAAILAACLLETSFFWVIPLSFRSLIDNVLGPRDGRQLAVLSDDVVHCVTLGKRDTGARWCSALCARRPL